MPQKPKKPPPRAVPRALKTQPAVVRAKAHASKRSVRRAGTSPVSKSSSKLAPKLAKAAAKPKRARAEAARVPRSVILPPKPLARRTVRKSRPTVKELAARKPEPARKSRAARVPLSAQTWQRIDALAVELGQGPLDDAQRAAIRAALAGEHSLVVISDDRRAPVCYQIASQLLPAPTVVLSPIAAALREQHETLSQRSVASVCVLPELSGAARNAALARIARGGPLLVFVSPEALDAPELVQALQQSGIALFAVEEAHSASLLSHEQRPSSVDLASRLQALGSPPVMALTRVATRPVRLEIATRLQLGTPVLVQPALVPENLHLVTKLARGENRQAALVRLVERLELPGLVLCATPHDADGVYTALRGAGIPVHRHHSAMTDADRSAELAAFSSDARQAVMVAVSAFSPGSGLPGIGDQPDVALGLGRGRLKQNLRFLVHYQSPASLEQYVREIQQAGADGQPALCVLMHESSHRSLHEVMHAQYRFKATHVAELGRALESAAGESRALTLETLALHTGQSRRTTDRLTALLADAGVVARAAGSVRVTCAASELDEACRKVGAQLYALREGDARRLAAVSAFAESSECKRSCLSQYLGDGALAPCGRCSDCLPDLLVSSPESLLPQAPSRRPMVQEFSVQALPNVHSGFVTAPPGSNVPSRTTLAAVARTVTRRD